MSELSSGKDTRTSTDKVVWLNKGWYPTYYAFCPSEKAWHRELKRLGSPPEPYPKEDGRCTVFESKKGICVIVTVREHDVSDTQVVGLLVHEAMHIWQEIKKDIGEKEAGSEQEAYALQSIALQLIAAYGDTRGFKELKTW